MKTFVSLLLIGLLGTTALAHIDPGAPGASHDMEEVAVALHDHLHDFYGSSYGAHGLEEAAATMHDDLHDWSNGELGEAQIAADMDALDAAWKSFKQTIHQAHVLNAGDDVLDAMYADAKEAYKTLRFMLKKVEA